MSTSVSGPEPVGTSRPGSADPAARSETSEHPAIRPIRDRRLILAVLCVSLLIVSLDNTILNVALPVIVRTLHASSSSLQWIVDSYAIVFAGLLLVAGSLGDRLGRKWVFMAGLVNFRSWLSGVRFLGNGRSADRGAGLHGHRRSGHNALDPVDPNQYLHRSP